MPKALHNAEQLPRLNPSRAVPRKRGSLRTLDRPKKKKKKHVQVILEKHEMSGIDNVGIKRILKLFDKETGRN